MVAPVDRDGYVEHLQALLPRGRAWTRDPDAVLTSLLRGLAHVLAALDFRAVQLLDEVNPARTTNLLSDWERVLGLPDDCSEADAALPARRAAVLEKLVAQPDLNPRTYIDLAASFGLTITVDENDQARAARISGLDASGGKHVFVWWVTISADSSRFFSVISNVTRPLLDFEVNAEFVCRLRNLVPAHTHLEVVTAVS